jgi:Protein of unknown function (DUF2752)
MQISWRRLAPDESDPELLWLSVSLGGLAAAAIWMALHLPWPHCFFLAITGHPCVGCGGTRAAVQFFHANFAASWHWNPLAFVFLCFITVFDIYAAIVLVLRAPRLRIGRFTATEGNWIRAVVICLLALNWMYLLSRPAGTF